MSPAPFWGEYKLSQAQKFGHVIDVLKAHAESTSDDRHEYLIRIVSIVQYLAKQGIAFRGHDEKESSSNRGNFLELLELLKKFDPFLQTYEPPKNATYTSYIYLHIIYIK